jgi:Lectin C-type domain
MKTLRLLVAPWARARHIASAAILLVGFVACGAPANNTILFGGGGSTALSAGTSGAADVAGAGSGGAGTSGANSGGSLGDASSAGLGGGAVGMSDAGSAGATSAGSGGSNLSGGAGGGAPLSDCTAFGVDATYYAGTQHCYLVVHDMATFADAKTHCSSLGAHLVTLSNQDENDFVWSLDTNEHWIGTTDGKGPKETTPGTYSWVDGEPFTYTDWSSGQPNASTASCGDSNGGGDCYEHCGFQWSGGDKGGEWNDRYCLHTIEAICERD